MVNIDTVYQRVLAIVNKEQRGYVTPQEFNLFAHMAQMEILEQYFYDLNLHTRAPGNETEYSNIIDLINEKLDIFRVSVTNPTVNSGILEFPTNPALYKLGVVTNLQGIEVEKVTPKELRLAMSSKLTRPSSKNPMYVGVGNGIQLFPNSTSIMELSYIRMPERPVWGYVVMNDRALYDPSEGRTVHFELHRAEEIDLVYKILKLVGISIQKQDVAAFANNMDQSKDRVEKQ
tara:strand:+ start:455 stop:1150 length:696 start_codon:yes stop_codon:yes gene_type:complete